MTTARVDPQDLTRRERQVLETVSRLGEGTVAEVQAQLPTAVSYDAVRGILRLLREKGLVTHGHQGKRYVYRPSASKQQAQASALSHLVRTFFEGSRASTMAALLRTDPESLTDEEFERLSQLVNEATRRRRS